MNNEKKKKRKNEKRKKKRENKQKNIYASRAIQARSFTSPAVLSRNNLYYYIFCFGWPWLLFEVNRSE